MVESVLESRLDQTSINIQVKGTVKPSLRNVFKVFRACLVPPCAITEHDITGLVYDNSVENKETKTEKQSITFLW